MPAAPIFLLHLGLGYLAWSLAFLSWGLPWLRTLPRLTAMRAIATLHSFRFFGLVFILPGVVGPGLPPAFASGAAFGDFATGLLALAALISVRWPPLFWSFAVAFNVVGVGDLAIDYLRAVQLGLPELSGQLGAAYAIPILYVPLLMITHVAAGWLLVRAARDTPLAEAAAAPHLPAP